MSKEPLNSPAARKPQPTLSDTDLQLVLRGTDRVARSLVRRLGLPFHQWEDLRQDLLAGLLVRLHSYDATRGTLGAFVGTIVRHHATRLAGRIGREQAALMQVSLDEPLGGALKKATSQLSGTVPGFIAVQHEEVTPQDLAKPPLRRKAAILAMALFHAEAKPHNFRCLLPRGVKNFVGRLPAPTSWRMS